MKIYLEKVDLSNNFLDENFLDWYNMLDIQKKSRVDRIADLNRKKIIIFSDHLARLAISDFNGKAQEDIAFRYNSHGKPFVLDNDLNFNISHSEEFVACCVSKHPCGIDIETIKQVNLKSAKRFCTANEIEYINSYDDKNIAFLYVWTRKEAYFKSIGCGIATVLSAVDVLKTDGFKTEITNEFVLSTYELINGG